MNLLWAFAISLVASSLQAQPSKEEALQRLITDLEMKVQEQQRLIERLLAELPANHPIRESMALASHPCGRNLLTLWNRMGHYPSLFGGRMKALPAETGPEFWLKLTRTDPPLLRPIELGFLVCPSTHEVPKPGVTSYRGPLTIVSRLNSDDPIGCCEPEAHADRSIVILLKSGDLRKAKPGDAQYTVTLEKTRGGPERKWGPPPSVVRGLKMIAAAQADFRANDRDANRALDFWVGDVSGLHRLLQPPGKAVRLVESDIAAADAAPIEGTDLEPKAAAPRPYAGYFFIALKSYSTGAAIVPYHNGTNRNEAFFGVAAYPAGDAKDGRPIYVMSQGNLIYRRDLQGTVPQTFPTERDLEQNWTRVD